MYDEAQRTLACNGPAVISRYGTLFTAVRDDVHGFSPIADALAAHSAGTRRSVRDPRRPDPPSGELLFVAFGVSVLTFLMIRLVPGDAAQIMLGAPTPT